MTDDGLTVTRLRYVELKSDGSFQFRRRIPKVLLSSYPGRQFIIRSLGKDKARLIARLSTINRDVEHSWQKLGWCGSRVTRTSIDLSFDRILTDKSDTLVISHPTITQCLEIYLSLHRNGHDQRFILDARRVVGQLIELSGDLPVGSYSRRDAEQFRDTLKESTTTSTVRRRLTSLVAIINRARREKQLQIPNPFEGLGIVGEGEDQTKRIPFTNLELTTISKACRSLDDDIRHIVAFQLDTGCRVAEVVGLRMEDVVLDASYPHVKIRPFGKVRTLKTAASQREIPLVGEAQWAAERAIAARRKAADGSPWLFPRYASDKEIKATHASNTLNKWLRSLEGVSSDKTTHCFRHAMRDRLRASQVPHDIQEAIGGWGTRTIGQGYGNGYPLHVLTEHLLKIVTT